MWMFVVTAPNKGRESAASFLSVVEYNPVKDKSRTDEEKPTRVRGTHVLIRARVPEHLSPLLPYVEDGSEVQDDGYADYRYRLVIQREIFAAFVLDRIGDITYDSHFKEASRDHSDPKLAGPLYSAMMKVWSTMATLQPFKKSKYSSKYLASSYAGSTLWDLDDGEDDEWSGYVAKSTTGGYAWERDKVTTPPFPPDNSPEAMSARAEAELLEDLVVVDSEVDDDVPWSDELVPSDEEDDHTLSPGVVEFPPQWTRQDRRLGWGWDRSHLVLHSLTGREMLAYLAQSPAWDIPASLLADAGIDAFEIWREATLVSPEEIPSVDQIAAILNSAKTSWLVEHARQIWPKPESVPAQVAGPTIEADPTTNTEGV